MDVNHASADALTTIPGVNHDLACQIAAQRDQVGGFSSIEDLETCLNVAPGTIDQMRETAVFIPGWPAAGCAGTRGAPRTVREMTRVTAA